MAVEAAVNDVNVGGPPPSDIWKTDWFNVALKVADENRSESETSN
jgi:hypothetical protein